MDSSECHNECARGQSLSTACFSNTCQCGNAESCSFFDEECHHIPYTNSSMLLLHDLIHQNWDIQTYRPLQKTLIKSKIPEVG